VKMPMSTIPTMTPTMTVSAIPMAPMATTTKRMSTTNYYCLSSSWMTETPPRMDLAKSNTGLDQRGRTGEGPAHRTE